MEVNRIIHLLTRWVHLDSPNDVDKAVEEKAKQIKDNLSQGRDAEGEPLRTLSADTLNGPVRRTSDTKVRKNYGVTPMYASGKTAESIGVTKLGSRTWIIGAKNAYGNMILSGNVNPRGNDPPFKGNVRKPSRDVLVVGDKALNLIEEELVKGIMRRVGI